MSQAQRCSCSDTPPIQHVVQPDRSLSLRPLPADSRSHSVLAGNKTVLLGANSCSDVVSLPPLQLLHIAVRVLHHTLMMQLACVTLLQLRPSFHNKLHPLSIASPILRGQYHVQRRPVMLHCMCITNDAERHVGGCGSSPVESMIIVSTIRPRTSDN